MRNGGHWVLAKSYNGNAIVVNDAGYNVESYDLSTIVDGNSGVYTINQMPDWFNSIVSAVENSLKRFFGLEEAKVSQVTVGSDDRIKDIEQ